MPRAEPPHDRVHEETQAHMRLLLSKYKRRVGLYGAWSLHLVVFCPEEHPHCEAYARWDDEVWYAELGLSCQVQEERHRIFLLVHELCELQSYREADYAIGQIAQRGLSPEEEAARVREYMKRRNQGIDERVQGLLGYPRPRQLSLVRAENTEKKQAKARTT